MWSVWVMRMVRMVRMVTVRCMRVVPAHKGTNRELEGGRERGREKGREKEGMLERDGEHCQRV